VRILFETINNGNAQPVIAGFAQKFEHVFIGDHALGGTRQDVGAAAAWYQRLFRLLPDIQFQLHRIDVQGPPWKTLAVVEWTETNSGTDGVKTSARGVLERIFAKGVVEAKAAPIES
jgi:ketosteroid isomerase-like protein